MSRSSADALEKTDKFRVGLIELGDVSHHLALSSLLRKLRRSTNVYEFQILEPIRTLPEPTEPAAQGRGFSPQFSANVLFSILDAHPDRRRVEFVAALIDSEVFDELFSTINSQNDAILVSLRTRTLPLILEKSGRSIVNYVGLEIAAQLLCIQYRRAANLISNPTECDPPWHIQRLNCLFDWYGISPTNVTKLLSPKLSDFSRQFFVQAAVPQHVIGDGVQMAQSVTKVDVRSLFKQLMPDPFLGVIMGALLGWVTALFSVSTSPFAEAIFPIAIVLVIAWRAYLILGDTSRM